MYTLFDQDSTEPRSQIFVIPEGFVGYFTTVSLDGYDHCIGIDVVTPGTDIAQAGGLTCIAGIVPGFVGGAEEEVGPLLIDCEQATLSTKKTKAVLSLPGAYRLVMLTPDISLGNIIVSFTTIPVEKVSVSFANHEVLGDSCDCDDNTKPCPSYPIGGGFMYGAGDVVDPEATVEITLLLCPGEETYYLYPEAGTYGPYHATYAVVDYCTGGVVGYAANSSPCGQQPEQCGCC